MSDEKQLEALDKLPAPAYSDPFDKGGKLPSPAKLSVSQFEELARREEIARVKAEKSRDAEARARQAILINALIGLVALIAEVLRQYSASKGHP
jgi:hypothetical protein